MRTPQARGTEFTWGVATSAYQIEGAVAEDGRVPSVWDRFTAEAGRVADGATGAVACDSYHRYDDDIALVSDLGVGAFRFSVAWPRIQPGPGQVNPKGLDFYDRLTDRLLTAGIIPIATLFHWDLPAWAQDAGGWRSRETADRFAEYTEAVARRLGDRVGMWSTMNEMFEHCMLGHVLGQHAPGLTLAVDEALAVGHHLLLAHGRAVGVLRGYSASPVMVVNSYAPARPATGGEADAAMAGFYDTLQNRLFTDPILLGSYPEELGPLMPADTVRPGDLAVISAPVDALGVNYYSVNAVRAVDGPVPLEVEAPAGYATTAFGWAVAPDGLTEALVGLRDRYGDALPPVWITENGCCYDDELDADGRCDDPDRIAFLDGHVKAMREAMADGVDVRGYLVWSLLDNFEWAEGFTKRFGLVHVDFETQQRTPKSSYFWFRDLISPP